MPIVKFLSIPHKYEEIVISFYDKDNKLVKLTYGKKAIERLLQKQDNKIYYEDREPYSIG